SYVSVRHRNRFDSMPVKDVLDTSLHFGAVLDVRSHPAFENRIGPFTLDDRRYDLRGYSVVRTVQSNGADGKRHRRLARSGVTHPSRMALVRLLTSLLAVAAFLELLP